jgi:diguanylate cyclase (GGDEF)-like protein
MEKNGQSHIKAVDTEHIEKLALIGAVDLFSGLLDADLRYVASRSCFRSVPEGSAVFAAGENARQFFILKSGSVSVKSAAGQTESDELARYVPGDVFGDFHFVIDGSFDATAVACEESELLVFPGDGFTFDQFSVEKPDTAARILLRSISLIEARIRSTRSLIAENKPWIRELRKLIFVDQPTGLWNKSFLDSELPQLLVGTVTVIMIKPDNFKELNDALGHAGGDEILRKIAALLTSIAAREKRAWAVRLRSNETGIVIADTDSADGRKTAKEIAEAFPALVPEDAGDELPPLTASVSIGYWPADGASWKIVAEKTNALLQDVWKNGGDRIALLREETT